MPNYKFFEPKKTDSNTQKTTKADGFNFKTTERSLQKQNSLKSIQSTESTDSKEFKARKMPDFTCQSQLAGVAIQAPRKLTQSVPFSFKADERGTDRVRKLHELKER